MSAADNVTDEVVGVDDETDFVQVNDDNQSVVEEPLSTNEDSIVSSSPGTLTDLRNEINDAADEYNLTRDYVFSSSDMNSGIMSGKYITILSGKNITINGNGHYIQGKNEYVTTFEDLGKKVVLNNITFKKIGSGVRLFGTNSVLCNCNFIDCENVDKYPCVVISNSLVENCTFINCKSTYDEYNYMSEIFNSGGVIYAYKYFNINNCTFINCMSFHINEDTTYSRAYGGAIYCQDTGNITNCKFDKCSAETDVLAASYAYGGAIYCYSGFNNIVNCSFTDCYAQSEYHSYGGAIYLDYHVITDYGDLDYHNDGHCIIENCNFTNSQTRCLKGDDSDGGAIYSFAPTLTLANCLFNNCDSNYGGAIYLKSNSDHDTIANIKNSEFNGNSAKVAGAIYENNNGTMVKMCKFINNTATNDAGALYMFRDYEYLSDCTFINNTASNNGAAIMWKVNGGSIISSIFVNNTANKDSGIFVEGGNTIVKDSLLFSNNKNPIICSDLYTVTANYNWWGNTIHNYNQQPTVPARINVKNWLFMNFTVDTNSLKVGEIATITCDLTHLTTSNGVITKHDAIDLPIINLIVLTDNTFDTSKNMMGGLCEAKYVATHIPTGNLTIKYNTIEETFYFTIEKAEIQLNISNSAILNGNLLVTAPNNATGIVHIVINNNDHSANMANGSARVSINDLPLGRFLATTSFESDSYIVNTFNSYIDIKSSIDANNLTKTQDSATKFQATFYDFDGNVLKNTKVTFMLNGRLQTSTTDNNGVASLDINFSPNTYEITSLNPATDETKINEITITASGGSSTDNNNTPGENTDNNSTSSGNTNGTNSSGNSNSTSNNPKPITDNQITIPSLDSGSGTIKLPNDASGTITLDIAGKPYYFTVVNGVCNVKLSELDNGVYGYILIYSGDAKYASFTKTGSIKVDKTPETPVDNKTNTTENTQENTTVVDNSKIAASNVNVVYSSGSYYTITVYGTNGELADGVNVKISGKISKSLTTSNGIAKFKITQVPGTYKITISALGKSVTKTITVKKATPKLTAKAKAFKKSVKNKNYVVTLKTNQNKVMKNTKLTLKVNGKTYSATTNAKGQATFKITKLTKKGKFNAVVTYKGNAYYNKLSKKVQIKIN